MNSIANDVVRRSSVEQLENARLHGNVERGGDLVANEELWLGRKRARYRDPLFLAAARARGRADETVDGR